MAIYKNGPHGWGWYGASPGDFPEGAALGQCQWCDGLILADQVACALCARTLKEIEEVNRMKDERLESMFVGNNFHLPHVGEEMAHLVEEVSERIRVIRRRKLQSQIAGFVWCATCGAPATNVLVQPFAPDYPFCDAHRKRGQRHWSGQESSGVVTLESYLGRRVVGLRKLDTPCGTGGTAHYVSDGGLVHSVEGLEPSGFVAIGNGPSSGEGGYLYAWPTEAAWKGDLGKWIAEARATHSPKTESIIFS